MLETIAVPVLLKAVDFLFGEGSKILGERRKRKQSLDDMNQERNSSNSFLVQNDNSVISTKDDALRQPIQESVWRNTENQVKHLLSLLEIYTKNYQLAKEKHAKWGSSLAPPILLHELSEAEDGVANTMRELQTILGQIYQKPVSVIEPEIQQ